MDEKKAAKLRKLEAESADLMEKIRTEQNDAKKRRMVARQESLQGKIVAIRGNRRISRDTKRSLVAYSFIAPNFIGFAVFTLIPIVFAFILAFMDWDGSNAITFVGLKNFLRNSKYGQQQIIHRPLGGVENHAPYRCDCH